MTATAAQRRYAISQKAISPSMKTMIKFYELQWFLRSRVPSVAEVTEHMRTKMPKIRQTTINYYLTLPQVQKALKNHGIPFEQHTVDEITDQQQAAALTVANFADKRPIAEKLDALGILPATYYAWLNDPAYRNLVQSLADQNIKNIDPVAKTEFAKKVQEGDWNAIKFYMENTGVLKNNDTPQSEIIIMKLIEILQHHIQDTNVLGAIANEMIIAFSNRSIPQGAITGEFSETDPELVSAKKQLGFG
jgi:glutathione peroxidase-family protein